MSNYNIGFSSNNKLLEKFRNTSPKFAEIIHQNDQLRFDTVYEGEDGIMVYVFISKAGPYIILRQDIDDEPDYLQDHQLRLIEEITGSS